MRFWRWYNLLWVAGISAIAWSGRAAVQAAGPVMPNPAVSAIGGGQQQAINAYVQYYSKAMTAATTTKQMIHARSHVLALLHENAHPASAIFLNSYGATVAEEFQPLLSNPKTALNAIITVAEVGDISTQAALDSGLSNTNPAVRYWAARGLGEILPQLAAIPPAFQQALRRLEAALKAEKDPIVAMSMCHALVAAAPGVPNGFALVLGSLQQVSEPYASGPPRSLPECRTLVEDLGILTGRIAALPSSTQTEALSVLAKIMSFTAQYNEAGLLSRNQSQAAFGVLAACGHTMDLVGRTTIFSMGQFTRGSDPAAVLLHVNHLTGSQTEKGKLQNLFPKVSVPARISTK